MSTFSCAECGVNVNTNRKVYFYAVRMSHLLEVMRETIVKCGFQAMARNKKFYCLSCVLDTMSPLRAITVYNPDIYEPAITGVHTKTQLELLRTIVPHYDAQTRRILEFRHEWLEGLFDSEFAGDVLPETIENAIGISSRERIGIR